MKTISLDFLELLSDSRYLFDKRSKSMLVIESIDLCYGETLVGDGFVFAIEIGATTHSKYEFYFIYELEALVEYGDVVLLEELWENWELFYGCP